MGWGNLGTLSLTYQWRTFDLAAVGGETFRASMPGLGTVDGYCLLRPYYAVGGAGQTRRLYPTDEQKILTFLIPPELNQADGWVRYFQARLSDRARVFAGQTWNLKLEEYY